MKPSYVKISFSRNPNGKVALFLVRRSALTLDPAATSFDANRLLDSRFGTAKLQPDDIETTPDQIEIGRVFENSRAI